MTKKKDTPPLTHEETIELLDKAIRNPNTKPVELVRLTKVRANISATPSLPSDQVLWKPEDIFLIEPDDTPEEMAIKEAANAIIQAPGFWTIGPDGNRWGPEMRMQGRWMGIVNGPPVGEWEETAKVYGEVRRKRSRTDVEEVPKPEVSASQREANAANAESIRKQYLHPNEEVKTVEQPTGLHPDVKRVIEEHRRRAQEKADDPDIIL